LARAQEAAGRISVNGQTMTVLSRMNVGPTVTGAPYSADAVNESIQILSDGNRIVNRTTNKIYRDSEGRERRESGDIATISDPVAKASYTLNPATKTFTKTGNASGNFLRFNTTISGTMVVAGVEPRTGGGPVQALGSRAIEGVPATGTRTTTTIPAGQIGNERPIEIIDEQWHSGELQVVVMTRHADPRTGETTYRLTNVQRSEPAKSLFEVPADYKEETRPTVRIATPAKPVPPAPLAPPTRKPE
jgi:hypothetical protein